MQIEFTKAELKLLAIALQNGMGDDCISNLGLTRAEQATLGAVGNRIMTAANGTSPFYDQPMDYA